MLTYWISKTTVKTECILSGIKNNHTKKYVLNSLIANALVTEVQLLFS